MEKNINLKNVINNDLCSGCGACAGICPVNAISFNSEKSFKPVIDDKKCIDCDLCYKICPGKGWNAVEEGKRLSEIETVDFDSKHGPVANYYLVKSTDDKIHLSGSSGGAATSLLIYLLEKKIVDKAAVLILEKNIPVLKITNDIDLIKKAAGSKYSPVPIVQTIINELKKSDEKIAITVIPCQMAALNNYLKINKKIDRNRIYAIGLFCGDLKEYKSVEKVAESMKISDFKKSAFLGWRTGVWPGKFVVKQTNGDIITKELQKWLGMSRTFYSLHRCLMCPSRENWLADISLSDNHKGHTDETIVVTRTKKGDNLIKLAEKDGFINVRKMNKNDDKSFFVTFTKFIPALSYIQYRKKKNLPGPIYDYNTNFYLKNVKKSTLFVFHAKNRLFIILRKKKILSFFETHPVLMAKTGYFVNRLPWTIPGYKLILRTKNLIFRKRT